MLISKGVPPLDRYTASNKGGVGKTSDIDAKCVNISKTIGDRSKVTRMTNRKLHTRFRLTPRSMRLNCISSNFQRISRDSPIWDATTAKRMEIEPYRQRQRCNPLNVLFSIMFLASICRFLC